MPTISQDEFDLEKLETPGYFPCYAYRRPENLKLFGELGPILALSRGHVLRAKGITHHCYMVIEGMMSGTVHGADDFTCQSAYFLEGSLLLEPSALSGLPANVAFRAVMPTKLMRIECNALKRAMKDRPGTFEAVTASMTTKLNSAHERLRETMKLDIRARIYYMLIGIAATCSEPAGGDWHALTFKVTQQQMSNMLGVNRVTVNNALQHLYEKGIVRKVAGYYHVLDSKGLLAQAG